jgi:rhomboid protease GluP
LSEPTNAWAGKSSPQDEGPENTWIQVRYFHAVHQARDSALVLTAAGINHRLVQGQIGVGLFVDVPDAAFAHRELAAFEQENRARRPVIPPPPVSRLDIQAAAIVAVLLIIVFWASRQGAFAQDWLLAGAAQAELFAAGQWWRVFTSLWLHADIAHLSGNLILGGMLGIFLSQLIGPGLAWLAILVAGGGGNALNLLVQPPSHSAIGASTAVFAALGMLAVLMLKRQAPVWSKGLRRWLPLATGVTLLAFLGFSGIRTDVGGHIGGFVAGCLVGAGFLALGPHRLPTGTRTQQVLGISALTIVGFTWLIALGAPGA